MIDEDVFKEAPELNKVRQNCKGCALGSNIYLYWSQFQELGKHEIEFMNAKSYLDNEPAEWQIVELQTGRPIPCSRTLFVPWSSNEILILGGSDFDLNRVPAQVFNTEIMQINAISEKGISEFDAPDNNVRSLYAGSVSAFVTQIVKNKGPVLGCASFNEKLENFAFFKINESAKRK